jgi:hypothetical protein
MFSGILSLNARLLEILSLIQAYPKIKPLRGGWLGLEEL